MVVRIEAADFDIAGLLDGFGTGAGAVVTFTGQVRNTETGDLDCMEIEHYPGMTEKAVALIEAEACGRWGLSDCLIVHRFGRLQPGERIMMVATAAAHRESAFQAAEFLMDYLKSRAPFWKKEITRDGAEWVAAKDTDEAALDRW